MFGLGQLRGLGLAISKKFIATEVNDLIPEIITSRARSWSLTNHKRLEPEEPPHLVFSRVSGICAQSLAGVTLFARKQQTGPEAAQHAGTGGSYE